MTQSQQTGDHTADALEAMANPGDDSYTPENDMVTDGEEFAETTDGDTGPQASEDGDGDCPFSRMEAAVSDDSASGGNGAGVKAYKNKVKVASVHGVHFKRVMVPVLAITGLLLLSLATTVALLIRSGRVSSVDSLGTLGEPAVQEILVFVAFPLGTLLLVGAVMFWLDVRRTAKRDGAQA